MTNNHKTIKDDFDTSKNLKSVDIQNIHNLRSKFIELASAMCELAPESKERNMAYVRLQEAVMWAVKAISLHGSVVKNNHMNATYE